MTDLLVTYSETREIALTPIVELYSSNGWSSANRPTDLRNGLLNSHSLLTAWDGDRLIGLGNAISDGHLVVYYPHLLVHPKYQRMGIGTELMKRLFSRYEDFHQHVLVSDASAVNFYRRCGFTRAGDTEPMWIYSGQDH